MPQNSKIDSLFACSFALSFLSFPLHIDQSIMIVRADLDDDTRIVRAGRTGNAEDDVVFYMVRDSFLYD